MTVNTSLESGDKNFRGHPVGEVWFWQRIVTPHMAELATEFASLGIPVTYVAEQPMSPDRVSQGWTAPDLLDVRLAFAHDSDSISALAASAPRDSIHICQGLRSNGLVAQAQVKLRARGLHQWVVMETVDDSGWRGPIKRFVYRRLFASWSKYLRGVLAIGQATPGWVVSRGMPKTRVFPFAYFLKDLDIKARPSRETRERFRFLFVGQFIELKRLDMLLDVLHAIKTHDFELAVVGSGPMESILKTMSERLLPGRIHWVGRLSLHQVPIEMAKADCLVLPSRHDGWGAVVSEAMMAGTPVICSDACGAAGVVRASGKGGVFKSGDRGDLIIQLDHVLSNGLVDDVSRFSLADWARCLGAKSGARYLLHVLEYDGGCGEIPSPPWARALNGPFDRSSSSIQA
jgi:glycosyltransferase involved in cell wall biosynthesis